MNSFITYLCKGIMWTQRRKRYMLSLYWRKAEPYLHRYIHIQNRMTAAAVLS